MMKQIHVALCSIIVSMMFLLPATTASFTDPGAVLIDDVSPTGSVCGDPVPEDLPEVPPVAVIGDLVSGYRGMYYNLPEDHPDVGGEVTGVVPGDSPFNHDWYGEEYFSFRRTDKNLTFGNGFFPVDDGLPGDPNYFAVHWQTNITVPEDGNYTFLMGSDDDSWLYIDGVMVIDLGGVHALVEQAGTVRLTAGTHNLEIYFAERHLTESGFYFEFLDPRIDIAHTTIWDDIHAEVGDTVGFKGSCSYDNDGVIQTYEWDFGDGLTGAGADTAHAYAKAGTYTVALTVADDDGLSGVDTCTVEITGKPIDLYVLSQDISVDPEPKVGLECEIGITVHSLSPEQDSAAMCVVDVYLDEMVGDEPAFTKAGVRVPPNRCTTVTFQWTPDAAGQHVIACVVRGARPEESDLSNNTAWLQVAVGEQEMQDPPALEYWIEYILPADQTTVDEYGIWFYTSGAYPDYLHCEWFNDTYSLPESDRGVYPMYNDTTPCTFLLHVRNPGAEAYSGISVAAIQEFHNNVTIWDYYGELVLFQGQPIPGTAPFQWVIDIGPGEEVTLNGYHMSTGRGWGLDQTHVRITWNGSVVVDDPVAGVYCPPP